MDEKQIVRNIDYIRNMKVEDLAMVLALLSYKEIDYRDYYYSLDNEEFRCEFEARDRNVEFLMKEFNSKEENYINEGKNYIDNLEFNKEKYRYKWED